MKAILSVFAIILLISCKQEPEYNSNLRSLVHENMTTMNIMYHVQMTHLQKAYLENKVKAGPYWKRAQHIERISLRFLRVCNSHLRGEGASAEEVKSEYIVACDSLEYLRETYMSELKDTSINITYNESLESFELMKFHILRSRMYLTRMLTLDVDASDRWWLPLSVGNSSVDASSYSSIINFRAAGKNYNTDYAIKVGSVVHNGVSKEISFKDSLILGYRIYTESLDPGEYWIKGRVFLVESPSTFWDQDFEDSFTIND